MRPFHRSRYHGGDVAEAVKKMADPETIYINSDGWLDEKTIAMVCIQVLRAHRRQPPDCQKSFNPIFYGGGGRHNEMGITRDRNERLQKLDLPCQPNSAATRVNNSYGCWCSERSELSRLYVIISPAERQFTVLKNSPEYSDPSLRNNAILTTWLE
jgi:hypothetical protein